VDISATVCLFFVRLFVQLRISAPRINPTASDFAWQLIGVEGRECPILGNFAQPEARIQSVRTNRPRHGSPAHSHGAGMHVVHVEIGMCGYTAVAEDGRTLFFSNFVLDFW